MVTYHRKFVKLFTTTFIPRERNLQRRVERIRKRSTQHRCCFASITISCLGTVVKTQTTKFQSCLFVCFSVIIGTRPDHPAHSCKHIRDFGNSNQSGGYWIDPERNGNPLKVFCEMTTDGGRFWKVQLYNITRVRSGSKSTMQR